MHGPSSSVAATYSQGGSRGGSRPAAPRGKPSLGQTQRSATVTGSAGCAARLSLKAATSSPAAGLSQGTRVSPRLNSPVSTRGAKSAASSPAVPAAVAGNTTSAHWTAAQRPTQAAGSRSFQASHVAHSGCGGVASLRAGQSAQASGAKVVAATPGGRPRARSGSACGCRGTLRTSAAIDALEEEHPGNASIAGSLGGRKQQATTQISPAATASHASFRDAGMLGLLNDATLPRSGTILTGSHSVPVPAASSARPAGLVAAGSTALRSVHTEQQQARPPARGKLPTGLVEDHGMMNATQRPSLQADATQCAAKGTQNANASGLGSTGHVCTSLPGTGEDDGDLELQAAILTSMQEELEIQRLRELSAAAVPDKQRSSDGAAGDSPQLDQSGGSSSGIAQTFAPEQWLNDASIACAYSRLAAEGLPEMVLLMDPATAFWMIAQEDQEHIEEARGALKIEERELVLCPINDSCDRSQADTGTHWTLLVCWDQRALPGSAGANSTSEDSEGRLLNGFIYYDSLGGLNSIDKSKLSQANALASRLAGRLVEVSMGTCAKQTNSFDCGVYVLVFSEIVAAAFLQARENSDRQQQQLKSEAVSTATKECFDPSQTYLPASAAPSKGYKRSAPVWEERLSAVTPTQVDEKRASYFAVFSDAEEQRRASTCA